MKLLRMRRGSQDVRKHFVAEDASGHAPSPGNLSLVHLQYLSNGYKTRECMLQGNVSKHSTISA